MGILGFLEKKGEVDSIDDSDLLGLDTDAFDQQTDDLSARGGIGLIEAVADVRGELIKAGECLADVGSFCIPCRELAKLFFESLQTFPSLREARLEFRFCQRSFS